MAMIAPNSQDGWYYDHWFSKARKPETPAAPSVAARLRRLASRVTGFELISGVVALIASTIVRRGIS